MSLASAADEHVVQSVEWLMGDEVVLKVLVFVVSVHMLDVFYVL